ncbi:MAG: alpha/beta fold hydrolase, partial [Pseudomonadota bacterium]
MPELQSYLPSRPKRLASLLFSAVALSLAVAPGPSADAQAPSLKLEPCRFAGLRALNAVRGECGSWTVPLDYDNPDAGSVELSVARVGALRRNKSPVAITVIAGGPGQSSLDFYAGYHPAFQRMRESFDIILVDQRGTGESQRLGCPLPDESLGGLWDEAQTRELAEDCLSDLPADPRFFTTSVAVRDLDAVRAALGYEQLSVYGISYGTRVAQHYLRRFPENTHSVILDGVVPVDEALGPDIAILAQRAIDSALTRCANDTACSAAFPDLATRFNALTESLREQPVTVTLNHPITAES